MEILHTFSPDYPFIYPALFAMLLYGGRYLIMAPLLYLVARPTPQGGWGRPHDGAPAKLDAKRHILRELSYSGITLLCFGVVNAVLFGFGLLQKSPMYFHIRDYPIWWFVLSIPVMLLLHDTFFYWMHRAMHTRLLFNTTHRVHHKSLYPTTFAAYSFHPAEAFGESLIVTAILFLIPTNPWAFFIFQTISTGYNVYGHCGREFYPKSMPSHWFGKWFNTSKAHATHHGKGRYNYGLYFMFWDRWMKTNDPNYK